MGPGRMPCRAAYGAIGAVFALLTPATAQADLDMSVAASVSEARSSLTVTITRTGLAPLSGASATIALKAGTATPGAEHGTAASPQTLTWNPLQTGARTATIALTDDALDEADETFVVTATADEPLTGAPRTVTITDDDAPPAVSVGAAEVTEGTGPAPTRAAVPISLSAPSGRDVAVSAALVDAAADAALVTGRVTIPAGQTSAALPVDVLADNLDEGPESLVVRLSDPLDATIGTAEAALIVHDDDVPTVAVAIVDRPEGDSGTTRFSFAVTLSNPSARSIEVDVATDDVEASAPSDYTAGGTTLVLAPGQTDGLFIVEVNGDDAVEQDESFLVRVVAARGAIPAPAPGVGLIRNDDRRAASSDGRGPSPVSGQGVLGTGVKGTGPPSARVGLTAPRNRKGRMTARVSCPAGAGTCKGQLTIFSVVVRKAKLRALRREHRLGTAFFTVQAGRTRTVSVRLGVRARRLLHAARRMRVRSYAVNRISSGAVGVTIVSSVARR